MTTHRYQLDKTFAGSGGQRWSEAVCICLIRLLCTENKIFSFCFPPIVATARLVLTEDNGYPFPIIYCFS